MAKQANSKTGLRSAQMRREPNNIKFNFPSGSIGVFMQITLAITFMYLILIGYTMMGNVGVVFVSLTFLLALFTPFLYRFIQGQLKKRKKLIVEECHPLEPEVERKG